MAALSVLSTLCIGADQYIAIIHPLNYHRLLTRARANSLLAGVWVISLGAGAGAGLQLDVARLHTWAVAASLTSLVLTHTLPCFALTVIYLQVYQAAHTNSARTRRNSAVSLSSTLQPGSPRQVVACRRLRCAVPGLPTGLHRSEPALHRQSSLLSRSASIRAGLGQLRRRISSASQAVAVREESRTARVYLVCLALLLCSWSPVSILQAVQVVTQQQLLSPGLHCLALLYSPLSALLHAVHRNTKIRRELAVVLGVGRPSPPRPGQPRLLRSASCREWGWGRAVPRAGVRNDKVLRHSLLCDLRPAPSATTAPLLLQLSSSSNESSARSSFSSASASSGPPNFSRTRLEATT